MLFKEYEEGRLTSGDGLFFAMMEQLKTHALELGEQEVGLKAFSTIQFTLDWGAVKSHLTSTSSGEFCKTREKKGQEARFSSGQNIP